MLLKFNLLQICSSLILEYLFRLIVQNDNIKYVIFYFTPSVIDCILNIQIIINVLYCNSFFVCLVIYFLLQPIDPFPIPNNRNSSTLNLINGIRIFTIEPY